MLQHQRIFKQLFPILFMPKKVVKSKVSKKESVMLEKKLIENFIALQKVMTNLSVKFDTLSDKISKLLDVFEISAKALAEKDFEKYEKSDNKDILEKLDKLIEQNKTIARGVAIMHEGHSHEEEDDLIGSRDFGYKLPRY